MKINFIVTRIFPDKFSGGIYCIFRHADELVKRGHEVRIIAYPKSKKPNWIETKSTLLVPRPVMKVPKNLPPSQKIVLFFSYLLDYVSIYYKGRYHQKAALIDLFENIPEADLTIATAQETASVVAKYGTGVKCYFCQHDESVFYEDQVEIADARATYGYGLVHVVNSTWLKSRIHDYLPSDIKNNYIYKISNGIDTKIFFPRDVGVREFTEKVVRIISYGGRDAKWKGFAEMVQAMREARNLLPEIIIEWSVFGDALIPSSNNVAPYNSLGFLDSESLADEYRKNDILLSASWYESFPLFPLEAMACGLAVITSALGVEDYAINEENCLLVEPLNVSSITNAIVRLVTDRELRLRLSEAGKNTAKSFDWSHAGQSMENILEKITQVGAGS